jgi:hypothetical protein
MKMPVRRALSDRLRTALADVPRVVERKMFGGVAFMVGAKMCISAGRGRLMCRIDPELHERATRRRDQAGTGVLGEIVPGFQ